MGIPGYQWLHLQARRRLVQKLDEAPGALSREDYLFSLVDRDVTAQVEKAATGAESFERDDS